MSNNYNHQSRKIVNTWFNRANSDNLPYDYFDKFIFLWVSFNCFFVSELYEKAKKYAEERNKSERENKKIEPCESDYLNVFCKNYEKRYSELLAQNRIFKETLKELKHLVETITHFKGKIADMRPHRLEEKYAQEFTDIDKFEQFVFSIYRIRCNLFHGNKSPEHYGDMQLVETAFKAYLIFLTNIYEKEEYLQE